MPKVRTRKFVLLLIFLHLAIVLPLAYTLNIWADEASTLYTTQHGFLIAFQNAATDEKQAPLYFWILSLWRSVDGSIFFARLFSIFCSAAAIALLERTAKRFFEPRAALLLTAFFALHPFLIWASVEIRVYSLVILLSIALIYQFSKAFWDDGDSVDSKRIWAKLTFVCIAILALYTNYYLAFILLGLFAVLLWGQGWRRSLEYLALMAVAAAAFVPLALVVRSQYLTNAGGFQETRSLIEGLQILWSHILNFLLPAEFFSGEDASLFGTIRAWTMRLICVGLIVLLFKARNKVAKFTIACGILTAVTAAMLLAAYFAVGAEYVAIRHASILFAPLILFVASLLCDVFRTASEKTIKVATLVIGLLVLISFSYSLTHLYPQMAKRGDWIRIGEFIRENEAPGQPIMVFTTFDALALPYHYHGVNRILPDSRFFDFHQEAAFGTPDSLRSQTEFLISQIPPDANEIWLVVNEKCLVTEACLPLENFIKTNYTIENERIFYLEKLYLLRKK